MRNAVAYGILVSYEDFSLQFNGGEMLFDLKEMCGHVNENITDTDKPFSLVHIANGDNKEDSEVLLCHITELNAGSELVRVSKSTTRDLLDSMGFDSDDCDTYLIDLDRANMYYVR